jgi:hypothetical protein
LALNLLLEFEADTKETTIAYRGTHRWAQIFEPTRPAKTDPPSLLKQQGVYLLTGGF